MPPLGSFGRNAASPARAHATVTKINASHLSMISHPGEVANVIEQAARSAS
ncbi:MAG: hypothetical protein JWM19_7202 [Actinomycetia bacterium]|nr:hypothetical protein [Actinomycetes bacterium]